MQNSLFKKLKLKFTLTTVLIAGIFLLVIFGTVFALSYNNAQTQISMTLNEAVKGIPSGDRQGKNDYIKFIVAQNGTTVAYNADSYDDEFLSQILEKVKQYGGISFKLNGRSFVSRVFTATDFFGETSTVYVVYDSTMLNQGLLNLGLTLLFSYIAGIAIIGLIAFFFSKKAVEPVEAAFDKQKELVANASHELKTPLTIIGTNLSVVKSDKTKTIEENKKWLDNIDAYISRMDSLIIDMLELSKLESAPLEKETVELSRLVQGVALSMDAVCFEKDITLTQTISPDLTLYSNQKQLERLCLILLDNAVKYTDKGGNIDVALSAQNKKITFSVTNSGKGIAPENMGKLFDRFYRADAARTSDGNHSFGLGLSIAKAITDNLGGKIAVESKENEYTRFVVTLFA